MWLVVVGVVLLVLKLAGLVGVAAWPWWLVLAPFAAAVLWWQVADRAGWTQRAAMRRQEERVQRRRDERMDALGLRRTPQRDGADKDPTQADTAAGGSSERSETRSAKRHGVHPDTRADSPIRPPAD